MNVAVLMNPIFNQHLVSRLPVPSERTKQAIRIFTGHPADDLPSHLAVYLTLTFRPHNLHSSPAFRKLDASIARILPITDLVTAASFRFFHVLLLCWLARDLFCP
jgi:hypothetical protein